MCTTAMGTVCKNACRTVPAQPHPPCTFSRDHKTSRNITMVQRRVHRRVNSSTPIQCRGLDCWQASWPDDHLFSIRPSFLARQHQPALAKSSGSRELSPSASLGIHPAETNLSSRATSAIRRVAWTTRWLGTMTARLGASALPIQWVESLMIHKHGTGIPTREMIRSTLPDSSGKSWWSSLLIDVGVAAAMYFAPEIETFIGNELGIALGDSDQAILTAKSANYGGQFAGLLTRSAATTAWQPEQDASAAGLLVALVPVSQVLLQRKPAQSTDQSNPQQGRGPVAPVPNSANQKTDCEHKILNATNNQFGTNFNSNNVTGEFQYSTGAPAGTGNFESEYNR